MISKLRFRLAAGLGVAGLTLVLATFVFGGVAYPIQLGNIGTFKLAVKQVKGGAFSLTPNGKSGGETVPAGLSNIGDAASSGNGMTGMVLEKSIDLGDVIPPAKGTQWTLRVSSDQKVTGTGIKLNSPKLCMASSNFEGVQLGGGFTLDAKQVELTDLRMEATSMQASSLAIPGLRVEVVPGGYSADLFGQKSCLG